MKVCSKCKVEKEYDNFSKDRGKKDGFYSACKECESERQKERSKNQPNVYHGDPSVDTKECNMCFEVKVMNEFNKHNRNKDGYQNLCKECQSGQNVFRKYGITIEDQKRIMKEQNYKCANPGCRVPEEETAQGMLYWDHCHSTGKVRGALCQHCNSAEGFARGETEILVGLAIYLGATDEQILAAIKKARKEQE